LQRRIYLEIELGRGPRARDGAAIGGGGESWGVFAEIGEDGEEVLGHLEGGEGGWKGVGEGKSF